MVRITLLSKPKGWIANFSLVVLAWSLPKQGDRPYYTSGFHREINAENN